MIHTTPWMETAQRIYTRFGFVRRPDRDVPYDEWNEDRLHGSPRTSGSASRSSPTAGVRRPPSRYRSHERRCRAARLVSRPEWRRSALFRRHRVDGVHRALGAARAVGARRPSRGRAPRTAGPPHGPGSLTDPGRRLGARVLDGLVFLPVSIVCIAIAVALVAPHAGPLFPKSNPDPNAAVPTPGFFWLYLAFFAAAFVQGALFVLYEAVATARYGRTLGKRWLKIRPVTLDGHALGWGRSFGRAGAQWVASAFGLDRPRELPVVPLGREHPVCARQGRGHPRRQRHVRRAYGWRPSG